MKRLWHHIKKDLNHLKYPLAIWWVLAVFRQLSMERMLGLVEVPHNVTISNIIELFRFINLFVLVPLLVQSDSLVGSTSFWLSRPISRKELLACKSLFILFFIIGPVLILEVISMMIHGITAGHILLAIPEMLFEILLFILPLMILAVLTPDFKRFALVALAVFVSLFIISVALFVLFAPLVLKEVFSRPEAFSPTMIQSQILVALAAEIILGCGIIIHQYLTRKTLRAIILLALSIPLTLFAAVIWQWDFFEREQTIKHLAPNHQGIRDFKVFANPRYVGRISSSISRKKPTASFSYKIKYSGIPEAFFLRSGSVNNIEILLPGGPTISPLDCRMSSINTGDQYRALQQVLSPSRLVRHSYDFYRRTGTLELRISGLPHPLVERVVNSEGTLSFDAVFHVYRYRVAAVLPLQSGSQYKRGSEYIRVVAVKPRPRGCAVKLQIQVVWLLFDPRLPDTPPAKRDFLLWEDMDIFLHNKKRQEILVKNDWKSNFKRFFAWELMESSENRVNVVTLVLDFSSQNQNAYFPRIDNSWMMDAELVCLEEENIGQFTKPVRIENFRLKTEKIRESIDFSDFSEGRIEEKADEVQETIARELEKIRLPGDATKEQVKKYIRKILQISSRQSIKRFDDIQVIRLAEVGPEHIDVLAEMGVTWDSKYYVNLALKRIAGSGNKEIILKILDDYPELIRVVIREGWVRSARDILVRRLEAYDDESLPLEWIEAIALLEDKSVYPLLKQALLRMPYYKTEIYEAIKNLPGIDLSDTIPQLWRMSKYDDAEDVSQMVPIALEWGFVDALEVAFDLVDDSRLPESRRTQLWKTINTYIEYNGGKQEIIDWFKGNKDKFVFDKQEKKFLIR